MLPELAYPSVKYELCWPWNIKQTKKAKPKKEIRRFIASFEQTAKKKLCEGHLSLSLLLCQYEGE